MAINIGVVIKNQEELVKVNEKIQNIQKELPKISFQHFKDTDDLLDNLANLDVIAIENKLFNKEFIKIQSRIYSTNEFKEKDKRIVLTNIPSSFDIETVNKWTKELNLAEEQVGIPISRGVKQEEVKDIIYFEYSDRKVYVKTNHAYYETKYSLKDVTENFRHLGFESPYVSFVVNLSWVEEVLSKDIVMKNGDILPLSQKKAHHFRKKFKEYLSTLF